MSDKKTLIYAHRGFTKQGQIPENTIQAFRAAFQAGADGIELDIRKTRDNQLVCAHDESAENLMLPGVIRDYSYEELSCIDPGSGEPMPLLEEVLSRFKHRMRFIIEVKEHDCEDLLAGILSRQNIAINDEQVIISSFIPEILYKVKLIDKYYRTALLVKSPLGVFQRLKNYKCDGIHPLFEGILKTAMSSTVRKAQKQGYQVIPWTVNNTKNMETLFSRQVDGIITDQPDIAVRTRDQ